MNNRKFTADEVADEYENKRSDSRNFDDLSIELNEIKHVRYNQMDQKKKLLTYYFHYHQLNNVPILEYNFLYLVSVSDNSFQMHKFVLQYPIEISKRKKKKSRLMIDV